MSRVVGETWQSLLNGINLLINALSPKVVLPLTVPSAAATLDQVTSAFIDSARDAAELEAQANPVGSGYARRTRRLSPVANSERHKSWAVRIRTAFEDHQAQLRAWDAEVENVAGTPEDTAFNNALSNANPKTKRIYDRLSQDIMKDIGLRVRQLALRKGLSEEETWEKLNYAATLYHIKQEAAEAYRNILVDDLASAVDLRETNTSAIEAAIQTARKAKKTKREALEKLQAAAKTEKARVDVGVALGLLDQQDDPRVDDLKSLKKELADRELALQTILDIYDTYQSTGQAIILTQSEANILNSALKKNLREGDAYVPPTAGGLSLAEVENRWAELRETFSEDELVDVVRLVTKGFETLNLERLKAGLITRDEQKDWYKFLHYVPLQTYNPGVLASGSHDTGYVSNPSKQDYRRHGSTTIADGALNLLARRVAQVSKEIGHRDVGHFLNELYEKVKPEGLWRIELNENETGAVRRDLRSQNLGKIPGYIYRVREDGRRRTYKFTFDFPNDQERTRVMRLALSEFQDQNQLLATLTNVNRWTGSWFTKYRPSFAPVAMFKDLGERAVNMFARGTYRLADGSLIEGPQVLAKMGDLLTNHNFLTTYAAIQRGQAPDNNRIAELWKEFEPSETNYSWLDYLNSRAQDTRAALKPVETSAIARASRIIKERPSFQKIVGAVNKYNTIFNAAPIFLQYAAFRQAGVAKNDAVAYTLDSMNYFKRGAVEPVGSALFVFFRATIQGGAGLLRALNPTTKTGTYGKARGAIAAGALLGFGLMLTTFLRALAGDDDEDNPYDAMDLATASRSINIFGDDGSSYHLPVAFGLQNLTWGLAQIIDRYGRGQMSAGDAMYNALFTFHRQVLPDTFPAYKISDDPTAWFFQTFSPQLVRPFMDVAVNRNHWGNEINYGNRTPGLRDFEKGRLGTDPAWRERAKWLHDTAGVDTTPETLRHVMEYYAFGPWQGLVAALGTSDWYEPEYRSTRETLGPLLTALGASVFYGAPRNVAQVRFFNNKRRIEAELTARGTRTTDPDNKPGEKAGFVWRQMTEAGFDPETINLYLKIVEADKAITKLNTNLRAKAESLWSHGLTDAALKTMFKQTEMEKNAIYEGVR